MPVEVQVQRGTKIINQADEGGGGSGSRVSADSGHILSSGNIDESS